MYRLLILLMVLLASCTNKKIDDKNFTIAFIDRDTLLPNRTEDFFSNMRAVGSVLRIKYTQRDEYKLFENTDAEIEYQKNFGISINRHGYTRRQNFLIGMKKRSSSDYRAFYITWTNSYPRGRGAQYFQYIPWEIGEYTDSLQSNLSRQDIKRYYPSFQGWFTQVQVDSIVLNSSLDLYDAADRSTPAFYVKGEKRSFFSKIGLKW